jgi:predicted MFS family arabinose efflux permease
MAGRAVGGLVVDRLGIARTVLVSGIMAVTGVVLFMFNDQLHLLYLALALWALGISNGFPLSINSFSDDTAHSAARINNIITGAFVVNLAMAPIIGLVGQVFGLSFAFVIPAALLVLGIALNKVLRPI